MGFSVPFSRSFNYKEQVDQFDILYKRQKQNLINFLDSYGKNFQRINIHYKSEQFDMQDLQLLLLLKATDRQYNIAVCFDTYPISYDKQVIQKIYQSLNSNLIPYYYYEKVKDWDTFWGLINEGVSDILIAQSFCFDLQKISQIAKNKQIKIRCFCNVCQTSWHTLQSLTTFFIRPQDIDLYSKYIDTFEFYQDQKHKSINALYKIYAHDKKWFGLLKELIIDYHSDQDNRTLIPQFGERRLRCNKECLHSIVSRCNFCMRASELGKALAEKKLYMNS